MFLGGTFKVFTFNVIGTLLRNHNCRCVYISRCYVGHSVDEKMLNYRENNIMLTTN